MQSVLRGLSTLILAALVAAGVPAAIATPATADVASIASAPRKGGPDINRSTAPWYAGGIYYKAWAKGGLSSCSTAGAGTYRYPNGMVYSAVLTAKHCVERVGETVYYDKNQISPTSTKDLDRLGVLGLVAWMSPNSDLAIIRVTAVTLKSSDARLFSGEWWSTSSVPVGGWSDPAYNSRDTCMTGATTGAHCDLLMGDRYNLAGVRVWTGPVYMPNIGQRGISASGDSGGAGYRMVGGKATLMSTVSATDSTPKAQCESGSRYGDKCTEVSFHTPLKAAMAAGFTLLTQ